VRDVRTLARRARVSREQGESCKGFGSQGLSEQGAELELEGLWLTGRE